MKFFIKKQPCIILNFKLLFWFFFFFLSANKNIGQHIPELLNYTSNDYKAGLQNWSLTHTENNTLYVANNHGLLVFNGQNWSLFPMENKNLIRSVRAVEDRVYCGSFEEIGYWTWDACGHHYYHSLRDIIPEGALENEEVWHIVSHNGLIFFQSFATLLVYDGVKIEKLPIPGNIMYLQVLNEEIWLPVIDKGIFLFEKNTFKFVEGSEVFNDKMITGMVSYPEKGNSRRLISTLKDGIFLYENGIFFPWRNELQGKLNDYQINKFLKLATGDIVIGTIRSGVFVLSAEGQVKYKVSSFNGLQNNSILSLKEDQRGRIWIGLDKGVSSLNPVDNYRTFVDKNALMGAFYSIAKHKDKLYFGTNQGVFYYESKNSNEAFHLINGTQGQVWQLKSIGDDLWCGHNEGTFIINNQRAKKISDITGGWCVEFLNEGKTLLLQGNYTGLALFTNSSTGWKLVHRLEAFGAPVKKIIQKSKNEFWVTGPYTGLSLITLDSDYKSVINVKNYNIRLSNATHLLPDINFWRGKLRVFDGKIHRMYNTATDDFDPDPILNKHSNEFLFRPVNDSCFFKIFNGYVEMVCVDDLKGNALKNENLKEAEQYSVNIIRININANRDYHNVVQWGEGWVGVCAENGYTFINEEDSSKPRTQSLDFLKLESPNLKGCIAIVDNLPLSIEYKYRDVTIYFKDNNYFPLTAYSYRCVSIDSLWRPLTAPGQIRLVNVPWGPHIVEVKVANDISKLNLSVLKPWYLSYWAFLIYGLLLLLSIFAVQRYIDRELKIKNQKLEEKNQRILKERLIQLENDRLIKENITKNKELANATLQLIKKNETLQEIKSELIDIRKKGDHTLTTQDFKVMVKQINDNLSLQEDKALFNASFEEVHEDFMKKLKSEFPSLTQDDLLLASYLRMNLPTKDIAPLFNLSLRGLENKRYRLRKKMDLPSELNLNDFFLNYI